MRTWGFGFGEADLGITADPDAAMRPGERFSLWTYTDDCDAAIARLRDAGVTIVDEPSDQPWGERMATVTDPDGNVVRVAQAPRD